MQTGMYQSAVLLEEVITRKFHQHSSPDDLVEEMESPQLFLCGKAAGETPPVKCWAFGLSFPESLPGCSSLYLLVKYSPFV